MQHIAAATTAALSATNCMTAKCFLDTNVVVYLFSKDEVKAQKAEQLMRARPTISTQVINEFLVVCLRKIALPKIEAIALAQGLFQTCDVTALDEPTCISAMDIFQRHTLSYWDSLIVAAALQSGCSILYSEDMQHNQQISGLTVLNPFLE